MRPSGRANDELREIKIETGVLDHAEGSCMISCGRTKVICSASVDKQLPRFRRGTGLGWITAEYDMLPRATGTRSRRGGRGIAVPGRTLEIQRLIGRALRAGVDMARLGERQIIIDCDVINADGGTRCAAISGGWVALRIALDRLLKSKKIHADPMLGRVAAVSCGIYAGIPVLDLDYAEDSEAGADANFVINCAGELIDVQCAAEDAPFSFETLGELLNLANLGVAQIIEIQTAATGR